MTPRRLRPGSFLSANYTAVKQFNPIRRLEPCWFLPAQAGAQSVLTQSVGDVVLRLLAILNQTLIQHKNNPLTTTNRTTPRAYGF